jgi:beta-N-acetylhexosaminidase
MAEMAEVAAVLRPLTPAAARRLGRAMRLPPEQAGFDRVEALARLDALLAR